MLSTTFSPLRIIAAAAVLVIPGAIGTAGQAQPVFAARSCPTVSGFIYHDLDGNGLRDLGEAALGGGLVELRNAAGEVVSATTADEHGYYEFFFDATVESDRATNLFNATFPSAITNWSASREAPAFDRDAGTLLSVDISQTATITSSIAAESRDSQPTSLTATVSGEVSVSVGAHGSMALPAVQAGQFEADAYDGESDFAGPSGHDFGEHSAEDSSMTTVTGADLESFYGPGPLLINVAVNATSSTTGSGNVLNLISTTASVDATLAYHFVPLTCLTGSTYTIAQVEQPDGYADGRETSGNRQPIPDSDKADVISVTVGDVDLPQNNFGELPGSLAGNVYADADDDGVFDAEEHGIALVDIRLVGWTYAGEPVDVTQQTTADGSYRFGGLMSGSYEIVETQPSHYLDGRDTIGSQGGEVADDDLSLELAAGVHGVQNNFGELEPTTPTPRPGDATVFPSMTPTADGSQAPDRDYNVRVSETPGAPGAGGGLAALAAGRSGINILLGLIFVICIGAGVLLMVFGRSEPAPRY